MKSSEALNPKIKALIPLIDLFDPVANVDERDNAGENYRENTEEKKKQEVKSELNLEQTHIQEWLEEHAQIPLILESLNLGFEAHAQINHLRKYKEETPYFVHPMAVAIYITRGLKLTQLAQPARVNMICAALLHDVLEDTEVTENQMTSRVGDAITALVLELTDIFTHESYPELNREARKAKEVERLTLISPQAMLIKLCDLRHNQHEITLNDPNFARVYLREKERLIQAWKSKRSDALQNHQLSQIISMELGSLEGKVKANLGV